VKLHGVAEEIVENLAETCGVADNRRGQRGGQRDAPLEFLVLREHAAGGGNFAEETREIERRGADFESAGLDAGEVEHVVDEAEEVCAGGVDDAEAFALPRRGGLVRGEDLRVADDGVERRAQFVAHAGDEVALGTRGGLGGVAGEGEVGGAGLDERGEAGALAFDAAEAPADVEEDQRGECERIAGEGPPSEPGRWIQHEGQSRGGTGVALGVELDDFEAVMARD